MSRARVPYGQSGVNLADTILVIEDVEILVHRKMLSILSPVFERLIFGDFKEALIARSTIFGYQNKETRIVLKDVQLDIMYDCLDIMHGVDLKYIPGEMDIERLSNLLLYADRFDISMVRSFCEWELHIESAGHEVDRYLLASQHNLDDNIKSRLFSFLTPDKMSSWSENALASAKVSIPSVEEADLARLFHLCAGKESSYPRLRNYLGSSTSDRRNQQKHDGFCDTTIQVGRETMHVNRSVMCYLSPFFYNLFGRAKTEVAQGNIVELEDMNAGLLRICLNVIRGKPVRNELGFYISSGLMREFDSSTLLELLDLSGRLSLPAVRVFCSMQMAIPSEGNELAKYLIACHFNLPSKTVILSRISSLTLCERKSRSLTSGLELLTLNFDVEDIRSLLAISSFINIKTARPLEYNAAAKTELESTSTVFKKSAYTDVVLIVGESKFYVNRMMMAMLSPYFNKLLVLEAKEQQSRFVMDGVDASLFGMCLHIVYGKMPDAYKRGTLSSGYMIGLLDYAHRFELEPVKLFCDHEMFENEKGHKMDRFLLSLSCYPKETKALLSNLTTEDIVEWLERDVSVTLPRARCSVKMTLRQLDRLIKLTGGEPLVDQATSVHIRPSFISKTALSSSKKFYLTVSNKGKQNILMELYQDYGSAGYRAEPYKKLAPGETGSILVEPTNESDRSCMRNQNMNAIQYHLITVPNAYWNSEPESIHRSGCRRVSTIPIPIAQ